MSGTEGQPKGEIIEEAVTRRFVVMRHYLFTIIESSIAGQLPMENW